VLENAHWKERLDAQIHKGQSWKERALIAVRLVDERRGTHYETRLRHALHTEGQAEHVYPPSARTLRRSTRSGSTASA
jgi:hypothetical protein